MAFVYEKDFRIVFNVLTIKPLFILLTVSVFMFLPRNVYRDFRVDLRLL